MNKHMKYQSYIGSVEVSVEDDCLFGKILFINALVTYEADSPLELKKQFEKAVDDYITDCRELDIEPERTCSGTFNVRIGKDLHKLVVKSATLESKSLNDFVKEALSEKVSGKHKHEVEINIRSDNSFNDMFFLETSYSEGLIGKEEWHGEYEPCSSRLQ